MARGASLLALALVVASCSSGSTAARNGVPTSRPATQSPTTATAPSYAGIAGVPQEVAGAPADWPLPGQSYDNARTAAASTITSANVARLAVAWRAAPTGLGSLSTGPLVVGTTVYFEGGTGEVVAVDRTTGKTRWTSAPTGTNVGPFGVAVGDGKVFADDGSNGVLALDERTGATVWRHRLSATKTLGVDIQPTVFAGLVFASTVPVSIRGIYSPGDRGTLYALDAKTGAPRWSFDTVLGALWGHPEVNSGGGAWYSPAIDVKRRVVYFGTANPAPFPGTEKYPNGTSRPGANLYTDSVLALKVDTGALLWYDQVTPHDLFDRDQVHVMLAHLANGHEVVISAGKSGEVLGLDPDTGRVLWQRAVGTHLHDDQRTLQGPTLVYPGTYGGVLTPPATADGVVYAAAINAPTKLPPNQVSYFGGQLGTHDGEVVALAAATGTVAWDTKVPGDPLGGITVVNDLVFTSLLDGTVLALNRSNGHIVWRYHAAGGINGWLSAVGGSLFVPVGQAQPSQVLALSLPNRG